MKARVLKLMLFLTAFTGAGGLVLAGSAGAANAHGTAVHSPSHSMTVPAALRPVLYRSLASDSGVAYSVNADGCAVLKKQGLKACFDTQGAHFTGAAAPLSLHLVAYGRSGELTTASDVPPNIHGNQVNYEHGNLNAWWRVLPVGFEQGFTIAKRPGGNGELRLALATSRQDAGAPLIRHSREGGNPVGQSIPAEGRNTNSHRISASVGMTEKGNGNAIAWGKLRYGKLVVTDAHGKVIPATLEHDGNRILIAVNDEDAAYPLVVDPLVWLEQKVTASDGAAGSYFGFSVALSGTTALIGAAYATVNGNTYQGAAYVFTEANGVWTQAQKLVASDGVADDGFGGAVALDGTTALVGAPQSFRDGPGAVYVFSESGGTWTQTARFTASDGAASDYFGYSLALDGTTALIGAYAADVNGNEGQGAAYLFGESDGTWTQTQKLTATDGAVEAFFGHSVALDGTTALIGADGSSRAGSAYVFTESDGTWTQTAELSASDGTTANFFGLAVALEGTTALVGAPNATVDGTPAIGAVYVFNESGGSWTQTAKLTPSDGASLDSFGVAVALDGTTAMVGADWIILGNHQGAVYVFKKSGGSWAQTAKIRASDGAVGDSFGYTIALEDSTALVGSEWAVVNGNQYQGAAYFYGADDLGLSVSAPQAVGQGETYVSQTIATNNASVASPAVSATVTVPAAASFVSATASQGSCSEDSGVVICSFGQIGGNAGMATANVTLKATGAPGTTIENTAGIAKATPALMASAATEITSPGNCAAGYTEFSGHLDAGETFTSSPIEVEEAGQKYVDLTAPASFAFFAITTTRYGQHTYVYPHAKHGHRWGAAGSYQVGVQAGPDAGGDYTLCVQLNPPQ